MFNLLNAYAHFDPEIKYCQGMNLIAAWILKFMREFKPKGQDGNLVSNPRSQTEDESKTPKSLKDSEELCYNEVDSFFVFVHVM